MDMNATVAKALLEMCLSLSLSFSTLFQFLPLAEIQLAAQSIFVLSGNPLVGMFASACLPVPITVDVLRIRPIEGGGVKHHGGRW
jgi:hypothetical protein